MVEGDRQRSRTSPGTRLTVHPDVWIQVATLCDQVIEARDSTLTLVRLVDRVSFRPGDQLADHTTRTSASITDAKGRAFLLESTLVVVVKAKRPLAETLRVRFRIDINRMRGKVMTGLDQELQIEPKDADLVPGVNFITSVRVTVRQEGLYWFNISCDGRLLGRVPLVVRIESDQAAAPTNGREGAVEDVPPTTPS